MQVCSNLLNGYIIITVRYLAAYRIGTLPKN